MFALGTIVNTLAIIAGGIGGLLFGKMLGERHQETLTRTCGVCTLFIGISGALEGMMTVEGSRLSGSGSLLIIACLAIGALIGEMLNIEDAFERFGAWLKIKTGNAKDKQFINGFVTASLTVCIGAMAIVGSIQDGLSGDPSTLFTKSILDFIIVIIFASTYGKGAIFSALPVGVLQGGVTICAGLLAPVFSPAVIANLSFLGSMLIFCVGVNLAFGNRFRVANMLPALVLGALFTVLI